MPLGELTKEIVKTKYTIRKNNIMSELTVGSKYIHFTKHGGVNKIISKKYENSGYCS
jgi:hypothetical protein